MHEAVLERVLVVGAKGRLGSALISAAWPIGTFVLPATLDQLDITDGPAVTAYLTQWRPDVVINAAAFTSVDRAEHAPETAAKVNHRGVENLADGAAAVGARLVHFSTGYVFDGVKADPYEETDQVNPLCAYGRSKRGGELAALELDDSLVIRTSWLYGSSTPGWIDGVRRLGRQGRPFSVVDDRRGSPTSVSDLAAAVVTAVKAGLATPGLFHLASPDSASWYDLADWVLQLDGSHDRASLRPVATDPKSTIGRRPANTTLLSSRFTDAYGVRLKPWREAMNAVWPQISGRLHSAPMSTPLTAPGPSAR
ncbi:MAG: dTDP-4-dehydrorhamnose reductase [Actinomycetota bacterium]